MVHLGDITKIDGHEIPEVDVIIGGSPCQDLSVAGKRQGLSGARSGLFMDQIRIIKEAREESAKHGRTGSDIRPRFMVWENVPGAFSSNKGEDFRAVLEETIRIADPEAPDVPLPVGGKWPLADCWYGDGWSVAYRVLDAQFWGVPQRRRRIAFVADFGGHAAPEILFVRKGVSGDSEQSREAEPNPSGRTKGSPNPPVAHALRANGKLTFREDMETFILQNQAIPINDKATRFQGGGPTRKGDGAGNGLGVGNPGDPCPTLTAADRHAVAVHQNGSGEVRAGEVANTLSTNGNATGRNAPLIDVSGVDCRSLRESGDLCGTIQAKENGGYSPNYINPVRIGYTVRRLTPTECERLQGFPDGWTDIEGASDTARYRALGNSIAIPPWKWVLKRLCSVYERDATMGSLFDGIGGFPFIWERLNGRGSCLWASEIDKFAIAVTKERFHE